MSAWNKCAGVLKYDCSNLCIWLLIQYWLFSGLLYSSYGHNSHLSGMGNSGTVQQSKGAEESARGGRQSNWEQKTSVWSRQSKPSLHTCHHKRDDEASPTDTGDHEEGDRGLRGWWVHDTKRLSSRCEHLGHGKGPKSVGKAIGVQAREVSRRRKRERDRSQRPSLWVVAVWFWEEGLPWNEFGHAGIARNNWSIGTVLWVEDAWFRTYDLRPW